MSMLNNKNINNNYSINNREITYAQALQEAVYQEMQRDDSVFLFGLDVDDHKAINGSTAGLLETFGKERVFTTPLSEDAMTGVAIGAAMAGQRPIHVHIRMDFVLLCMNQLINMAAKSHYMYNGQVKVPLTIRTMIGRSWGQGGQHSQALQSLLVHIPGLKVLAPSNAYDAKGCLTAAVRDDNPVIVIEHRLLYNKKSIVPENSYITPMGKARLYTEGTDITIVAISHMVLEALRANKLLADNNVSCEIIDPISLWPLDITSIFNSIKKTKNLLIVDNAWLPCGLSSEIITQIAELCQQSNVNMPNIARMGFAHTTCPTTKTLEDYFYPNYKTIAHKAYALINKFNNKKLSENNIANIQAEEIDEFKGPF